MNGNLLGRLHLYCTIASLFILSISNAQNSGIGFQFNAIAFDENNNPRINEGITLRFAFLLEAGDTASIEYYSERQSTITDNFGAFSIVVGHGQKEPESLMDFQSISFYKDFWLQTKILNGNAFVELSSQKLHSVPYAENAVPVGAIIPFAGSAQMFPEGWMLCDGRYLHKTEYPRLYDVIGVTWTYFQKADSFAIPDLRGEFLRGANLSTVVDPDAKNRDMNGNNNPQEAGSYQLDEIIGHSHFLFNQYDSYYGEATNIIEENPDSSVAWAGLLKSNGANEGFYYMGSSTKPSTDQPDAGLSSYPEDAEEMRPLSWTVNYLIRIW